MPLLLQPGDNRDFNPNKTFDWDEFITSICKGEYVLLLGPEIILNTESKDQLLMNAAGNVQTYIFTCLQKVWPGVFERYASYNEMVETFVHNEKTLSDFISELFCRYIQPSEEEISPKLLELLRTKCFRFVITTTYDPFIEKAMELVWGKGKYQVRSFHAKDSRYKDLPDDKLRAGKEYFDTTPTLFYLMGNINPYPTDVQQLKSSGKMPLDYAFRDIIYERYKSISDNLFLKETEFMSAVSEWLRPETGAILKGYIQSKKILTLGAKYDDWAFRFLWYALRGGVTGNADVAMSLETNSESDGKLKKYLDNQGVHVEINPDDFSAQINEHFSRAMAENRNNVVNILQEYTSRHNGFFISYASEDYNYAYYLYIQMKAKGLNVWLDYPPEGDHVGLKDFDDYNTRIQEAITASEFFIPILSKNTKEALDRDEYLPADKQRYFHSIEWQYAKRLNKTILPIAVGVSKKDVEQIGWTHCQEVFGDIESNISYLFENSIVDILERLKERTN